jgi:hypothetical protein
MQNHRIRPLMKCLTGLVLILGMVALAMVFPVTGARRPYFFGQ